MGKKTNKSALPVLLPKAHLPGRTYDEDRPSDCSTCYFWKRSANNCRLRGCFFLRPLPPKVKERYDKDGRLILDCRICPYNRVSPCIGYCIAKLSREVVGSAA